MGVVFLADKQPPHPGEFCTNVTEARVTLEDGTSTDKLPLLEAWGQDCGAVS